MAQESLKNAMAPPLEKKRGRCYVEKTADGSRIFTSATGAITILPNKGGGGEEDERYSPARGLIEAARAARTSLIEEFEAGGRTWYLLTMNDAQRAEVAIRMRNLSDGVLKIHSSENFKAFQAAALQIGVVKGLKDPAPFFDPTARVMDDAYGNPVTTLEVVQWLSEPGLDAVGSELFDRLTDINPKLWPKKKEALALAAKAVTG